MNKGSLKKSFESFPDYSTVIIDAGNAVYIDHDGVELIKEFYSVRAPSWNIRVALIEFKNI